jgi:hypothetical protein
MFDTPVETRDRVFVTLLVVAVLGALIGIRLYASHLQAEKAKQASLTTSTSDKTTPQQSPRVLKLEALTHVFECERDGKRVLTDRPCGTGVPIQVIR